MLWVCCSRRRDRARTTGVVLPRDRAQNCEAYESNYELGEQRGLLFWGRSAFRARRGLGTDLLATLTTLR